MQRPAVSRSVHVHLLVLFELAEVKRGAADDQVLPDIDLSSLRTQRLLHGPAELPFVLAFFMGFTSFPQRFRMLVAGELRDRFDEPLGVGVRALRQLSL